jgi:1-acyl-sn-glycerol-3-phosphate acyltransferase
MSFARTALLAFFRRVSAIYFRDIEVVGELPEASTHGRLFAPNHVNALVDPVLVMTNAPCAIAPIAKSTLWKIPVLRGILDAVGAVPVVRRRDDPTKVAGANDEVFARVASHLTGGGNVLIFPEGTSHNEPHVVKVRSGPARMLARAHDEGARGLTFQAVGLEFDERDTFRSRALVVYGPVRSVDALDASGDALVDAITAQLRADLAELVVEGDDWEERRLVARIASLFAHEAGDASLARWNEIGRRVEAAKRALRPEHAALYRELKEKVTRYFDTLDAAELRDIDVVQGDATPRARGKRAAILALTLPLAIPGVVLYWLPYQIPRVLSRKLAKGEADSISTYKLATGLVVFPVWAGALVATSFATLPLPIALAASGVVVASPFAALTWLDHLEHRRVGLRRASRDDVEHLRSMRAEISSLLLAARAELAPETIIAPA